jgi:hypothetical protein
MEFLSRTLLNVQYLGRNLKIPSKNNTGGEETTEINHDWFSPEGLRFILGRKAVYKEGNTFPNVINRI